MEFGRDEYFEISLMPERVIVTKHIRKKMRCKACGAIAGALSDAPFYHSPISASFAASVVEKKLELGVPLDRQARKMTDLGLPTTTQLLSETFLRAADLLKPVWDGVVSALSSTKCGVINADETPVKVLDERKEGRLKSQVFVYASSWFEHPMAVYDFSVTREMGQTKEILRDFKGTVICDGYSGYEELAADSSGAIGLQYCWSHARRYWFDAWKSVPKESQARSQARPVVEAFDAIFAKERAMRDADTPPSKVAEERSSDGYGKLLSDLKAAVGAADPLAGAKLADAKRYFDNHWETGMKTFLSDGHIDISNNLAERSVKAYALSRRNFLFCKTKRGAEATGRLMTLIQTAKLNGLDAERYLSWAMSNASSMAAEDLLPWSEKVPGSVFAGLPGRKNGAAEPPTGPVGEP